MKCLIYMQYNVCMCNAGERLLTVSWDPNAHLARKQSGPEPDRELLAGTWTQAVTEEASEQKGATGGYCRRLAPPSDC